jgi:hypothetical protein
MSAGQDYLALKRRCEEAERERNAFEAQAADWQRVANEQEQRAERAEADNAALVEAFSDRDAQWADRADWQGFCPLRRTVGCEGTDGRLSGFGTPRPKPHGEHCPFRLLTQSHPGAALLAAVNDLRRRFDAATDIGLEACEERDAVAAVLDDALAENAALRKVASEARRYLVHPDVSGMPLRDALAAVDTLNGGES